MIILVDFENTHASGMEGYQYLNETDTVVMYYSDENSAITKGMVDDLKERNVNVRMVKLLKQHSNALDMYIASTTGMFLDSGEKICIVSKDKGYAAVKDFWHSLRNAEILLGETIEECFLHSVANDEERIRNAKERQQKALLTDSFETMNKIPTRPTLSRYSYRRRRNILDTTRNLDPVKILPNPLWNPNLQDAEPDEEDEAVQERGADAEARADAVGDEGSQAALAEENAAGGQSGKDAGREQGRTRQSGRGRRGRRQEIEEAREEAASSGQDAGALAETEEMPEASFLPQDMGDAGPEEESGGSQRPSAMEKREEKKQGGRQGRSRSKELFSNINSAASANDVDSVHRVIPRINPNQVQYIYDPATGQMKKMEMEVAGKAAPEGAEAETADTASPGGLLPEGAGDAEPEDAAVQYVLPGEGGGALPGAFGILPPEDKDGDAFPSEDAPAAFSEDADAEAAFSGGNGQMDAAPGVPEDDGHGDLEAAEPPAAPGENALADPAAQAGEEGAGLAGERPADPAASFSQFVGLGEDAAMEADLAADSPMEDAPVSPQAEAAAEGGAEEKRGETVPADPMETEKAERKRRTGKRRGRKAAQAEAVDVEAGEIPAFSEKPAGELPLGETDPPAGSLPEALSDPGASEVSEASFMDAPEGLPEDGEGPKTPELDAEAISELIEKYGSSSNTLHQYYLKIMKAYGKAEGKPIYDASKKAMQAEIKRRKAAE